MTQLISKLIYLTKGNHKSFVTMLFTFIFISCLEAFGTGIIGPFVAIATNPESIGSNGFLNSIYKTLNLQSEQQFLLILGLFIIIIFYAKAFFSFYAQKAVFQFGYNLKSDLARKLLKAYLKAPYSFHLRINSSTLIQNVIIATDNVSIGAVMPLMTAISNIAITLALLALLIHTSYMAIILIVVLLPIVVGLIKLLRSSLSIWSKESWESSAEMIRILNHGLGGLKETRIIGCEAYFEQQMQVQTERFAKYSTLANGYGNLPRFVIEAFMITFLVVFILLFLYFDRGGQQNLNAILGIFALSSIRLLPAISNTIGSINNFRYNSFSIEKLYADFKEIEKVDDELLLTDFKDRAHNPLSSQQNSQLSFHKCITLERISFQYPGTKETSLDDISLKILKGQSIGLIGKSGAGKTTLVDIILGLFIPDSGDIQVDGASIYKNMREWQNTIGYVPQSIFLIDDTLEKNIAFGVPEYLIDRDRLQKAIEMAQLSEVVERLPNGIHTMLGERGVMLSGGQRQRVGIARVLYYEREIIVFDEATAALDTETEHLVTEATKALSRIKTVIIIAHRLSTIEHCDVIYQLDRGKILNSGSYQEVVLGQ
jgi:ATP-binding cassette, subfamily B, bacterial PglK